MHFGGLAHGVTTYAKFISAALLKMTAQVPRGNENQKGYIWRLMDKQRLEVDQINGLAFSSELAESISLAS
jgi:hypothetical protein